MTHPSITTDPRTRAALFVPSLDGGGTERMMVTLASGFAERGFQTDLVLAEARGPYPGKVAPRVRIEGEKRADLEALALELEVADDVSLPGFVDNPFAFMARADTFALSSRFEGLPGALIQAMACGCRVVSTDCPSGPSEILQGGALAPLVGIGDVNGLSEAMIASLAAPADPALRARALDFSEEKIIPQYLEVLLSRQGVADG